MKRHLTTLVPIPLWAIYLLLTSVLAGFVENIAEADWIMVAAMFAATAAGWVITSRTSHEDTG